MLMVWESIQLAETVIEIPFAPLEYCMDGHSERAFFQKSQTFGFGQTNWAEKCRGILGIFGQTTVPILAL